MKLKIDEIELDEDIYPRKRQVKGEIKTSLNQKTIATYMEALKAGAKFPPITVQKILVKKSEDSDEKIEKTIIMDGAHRLNAHIERNKEIKKEINKAKREGNPLPNLSVQKHPEIEVTYWRKETLDKQKNLKDLRVASIKMNLEHGDRLTEMNKKYSCRIMAIDDPKEILKYKNFAELFNVTEMTISNWISDIRARQKGSRNSLIYKLHLLGWQDLEIAKLIGVSDETVRLTTKNLKNFKNLVFKDFQDGKPVEEIAQYHGLDLQTAWALVLQDKSDWDKFGLLFGFESKEEKDKSKGKEKEEGDEEEFAKTPLTLKIYDNWTFSDCNDLMGVDYPGRIPGQLVMNTLYRYTKPGDMVVDFMAGSGTTADACLLMNRGCYSFDRAINEEGKPYREFIKIHELIDEEGNIVLPKVKTPNLIFVDPPYWSMKREKYGKQSFSDLSLDKFYEMIEKFAIECYKILHKDGVFAFLIQNQTGRDMGEKEALSHTHICTNIFEKIGFELVRIIGCPQSTQQDEPQEVQAAKKEGKMLGIVRMLLIFKKKE